MRTREEIEKVREACTEPEAIRNGVGIVMETALLLEVLLDIRELLTQHNSEQV